MEALERHRELDHTLDRQGSEWEDRLLAEIHTTTNDGCERDGWWRKQVEPLLTPDMVFIAAALGLAYGLATLGIPLDVIVAVLSFTGATAFIYILKTWPADAPHGNDKTSPSSSPPRNHWE
jgi:hypothetical protein